MVNCSVCLEQLKSPVTIPCGHLHCEKCLTSYIQAGRDAIHSKCPTCRTKFTIVTPDLRYVPEKYHEFIKPSVQRVWIDIPSQVALNEQLNATQSQLDYVKKDNQLLMAKCESNTVAANKHAEGERKARREAEKLRRELADAKEQIEMLYSKLDNIQTEPVNTASTSSDTMRPKRPLPRPTRAFMSSYDPEAADPPPRFTKRVRLLDSLSSPPSSPPVMPKRVNTTHKARIPLKKPRQWVDGD